MYLSQSNGPALYYYQTITETIEHIRKSGFTHVDISFFSRFQKGSIYFSDEYMKVVDEYREALKKYGVTPVQAHEPTGNSLGDDGGEYYMKKTPRSIEMAAKIGCPSITIHPGHPVPDSEFGKSKEAYVEGNVAAIKKLIPYAEEYGIELLLENIGYKGVEPFNTIFATTAEDIIDIVERARAATGLELELLIAGRQDPTPFVAELRRIAAARPWVRLVGEVHGRAKAEFMLSAAYAVHAERDETFGIVITEYLKAGCVVIAPDEGGAGEIKNGMGCKVEIIVEQYERAVYVPVQCVVRIAGSSYAWRKTPNGGERVPVETGLANNKFIRILSGLSAGEEVMLAPPLSDSVGGAETELAKEPGAEEEAK